MLRVPRSILGEANLFFLPFLFFSLRTFFVLVDDFDDVVDEDCLMKNSVQEVLFIKDGCALVEKEKREGQDKSTK